MRYTVKYDVFLTISADKILNNYFKNQVNSPDSLDHLTRNGMPLVIKTLLLGSPG